MTVKTIKQANDALHRIAEIECEIKKQESVRDGLVSAANSSFTQKTEKLESEKSSILDKLKEFCDEHRNEFIPEGKASADIGNGTLGYRKSPEKIEVSEQTARLLEEAGLGAMVKVTKEPVKAALKNLSAEMLSKVEAKKVPGTELFFAKANEIRYTEADAELSDSVA